MDATETRTIESFGVERKIGLARASLGWEDLWPRLVPLLAIVMLFVAAAHLDLFAGLDPWIHTAILAALVIGSAGLGFFLLRRFRWPSRDAAIRRLERDSGVAHRPLVAVQDQLASGSADPMAAALWQAHRRREAQRLSGLANKPPRPVLAIIDTWALRVVPVEQARTWVGVAGTMTTVAALAQGMTTYDSAAIHLSRVGVDRVLTVCDGLIAMPRAQRAALGPMHEGRIDVIGGGAIVIEELAYALRERAGIEELTVSEHDILDGIALSIAN